jgi:hypothetical protein
MSFSKENLGAEIKDDSKFPSADGSQNLITEESILENHQASLIDK